MANQTPTAVVATVTIDPARKQNMIPFARLYMTTRFRPQILSKW